MQLASQTSELAEQPNTTRQLAFRDHLKARITSMQKQLDQTIAEADASAQAASQLHSSLANFRARLAQPDLPAVSTARTAVAADTSTQLLAAADNAAQHIRSLECSLAEAQCQLQASKELSSAQQHQLAELQEELARERASHALTAAREEQVTEAMLAGQQQHLSRTMSAQSSQQALQSTCVEVAFLQAQLHTAHQALTKNQAATATVSAYHEQQLASTCAQLQQQRQATVTAQVASAAKTFACARLSAQMNILHAELQESQQQHQAATAAAHIIITGLNQAHAQLMSERNAARQACADEHRQHRATKAALALTTQELQASCAALSTRDTQLSCARKALTQQQRKASAALGVQQQSLHAMTQRMQQNREAAARAFATASASQFAAARTAAKHSSLQERLQQVRMQRDAAAAFVDDLNAQLQQAHTGKQVAEHALTAERKHNSGVSTALTAAWNQLDSTILDAVCLQEKLTSMQPQHSLEVDRLHDQLTTALRQHSMAARDAACRASAVQQELRNVSTECASAQLQLQAANSRAKSAQTELQDAQLQAAESQEEISSCRMLLRNHRRTTANAEVVTVVLQEQLDDCKLQLQQQSDAATSAQAKAQASEFVAASLAAQCAQLQQDYSAAVSELSAIQLKLQEQIGKSAARVAATAPSMPVSVNPADTPAMPDSTWSKGPSTGAAVRLPVAATIIIEQLAAAASSSATALKQLVQDSTHDSCRTSYLPAQHPAAAASPKASFPTDTDPQHSSGGFAPATPPRRTVSWGQRALGALKLSKEWGSGISTDRSYGSEGGVSSSTGSNSSSRDTSSGGFTLDIGSSSAGSKQAVAAHVSVAFGGKVCAQADACAGQADDTDVFDAQEMDCALCV